MPITRWGFWRRLTAALLIGFAMGTGLHVGRPGLHVPYVILQIDDSEAEIPWEWVPGLIIHPREEGPTGLAARVDREPQTRASRIARLLRRIRHGLAHYSEGERIGLGPSPAGAGLTA
jgi:hypothetical protein